MWVVMCKWKSEVKRGELTNFIVYTMKRLPRVLMVGPGRSVRGGVTSVLLSYEKTDWWRQHRCIWLTSYRDTSALCKIATALWAWLWSFVAVLRVDIVHIHASLRTSLLRKCVFIVVAKMLRRKVVLHMHAPSIEYLEGSGGSILIRAMSSVDVVVALSKEWKDMLSRYLRGVSIVVVPNPVEIYQECERAWNQEILFVGKIEQRKGIDVLLRAMVAVLRRYPDARLIVAGHGDIRRSIDIATELGVIGNVEFRGWVSREDLKHLWCDVSMFCLPSFAEGVPIAMLEAMSSGLPVVTCGVGGIPDVVEDGVNGLLVDPGDSVQLAEAIVSLLGNPSRGRELGRLARETIRGRFGTEAVVGVMSQVYQSLR